MSVESRDADRWWHSLPDERRAQIHRWIDSNPDLRSAIVLGDRELPFGYDQEEDDQ